MSDYIVKHVSERRFELHNNEDVVMGYLDYHEGAGNLYLDFVYVDPKFRGQKVGVEIVKEGIKIAEERNLKPTPICGYAGAIMKRNNWPDDFKG